MFIFKRVPHLRDWIIRHRKMNKTIGFVPTMGALHEGHLSLIRASKTKSDFTVASVFVNPLQFNDPEDLRKYPRPVETDIRMLYQSGTDVLFFPDVADIYPVQENFTLNFEPGDLDNMMEGKFRPGHFKGVAEVVYRLLRMVDPDQLFLGQKDFQQVAIIRKLIAEQKLNAKVIVCPTVREDNGLAMSSRNARLTDHARSEAGLIYQVLQDSKQAFEKGIPPHDIEQAAMKKLRDKNFDPEYFEIVDGHTLQPIRDKKEASYIVACCAVNVEGIRLIDNLIFSEP